MANEVQRSFSGLLKAKKEVTLNLMTNLYYYNQYVRYYEHYLRQLINSSSVELRDLLIEKIREKDSSRSLLGIFTKLDDEKYEKRYNLLKDAFEIYKELPDSKKEEYNKEIFKKFEETKEGGGHPPKDGKFNIEDKLKEVEIDYKLQWLIKNSAHTKLQILPGEFGQGCFAAAVGNLSSFFTRQESRRKEINDRKLKFNNLTNEVKIIRNIRDEIRAEVKNDKYTIGRHINEFKKIREKLSLPISDVQCIQSDDLFVSKLLDNKYIELWNDDEWIKGDDDEGENGWEFFEKIDTRFLKGHNFTYNHIFLHPQLEHWTPGCGSNSGKLSGKRDGKFMNLNLAQPKTSVSVMLSNDSRVIWATEPTKEENKDKKEKDKKEKDKKEFNDQIIGRRSSLGEREHRKITISDMAIMQDRDQLNLLWKKLPQNYKQMCESFDPISWNDAKLLASFCFNELLSQRRKRYNNIALRCQYAYKIIGSNSKAKKAAVNKVLAVDIGVNKCYYACLENPSNKGLNIIKPILIEEGEISIFEMSDNRIDIANKYRTGIRVARKILDMLNNKPYGKKYITYDDIIKTDYFKELDNYIEMKKTFKPELYKIVKSMIFTHDFNGGLLLERDSFLRCAKSFITTYLKSINNDCKDINSNGFLKRIDRKIVNAREDRTKKMASEIVQKAKELGADTIAIENVLFKTSKFKSRDENKLISSWRPQYFIDTIKQIAQSRGVNLKSVNPYLTSQLDFDTGQMGYRFNYIDNIPKSARCGKYIIFKNGIVKDANINAAKVIGLLACQNKFKIATSIDGNCKAIIREKDKEKTVYFKKVNDEFVKTKSPSVLGAKKGILILKNWDAKEYVLLSDEKKSMENIFNNWKTKTDQVVVS